MNFNVVLALFAIFGLGITFGYWLAFEMTKKFIKKYSEESYKAIVFVKHIEQHIKDLGIVSHEGKVICKICNKTIDEIAEENKKE